jgi:pimeloyl-ACP methyl ester carboxylesterase
MVNLNDLRYRKNSVTIHKKLVLSESVFGPGAYGDSYVGGGEGCESERPLVICIGGSISDKIYEDRRKTAPVAVANEFAAVAGSRPAADLLVCPFPSPARTPQGNGAEPEDGPDGVPRLSAKAWQSRMRERFAVHLVSELLHTREAALPSSLAFIGFSSGAYLAVGLALDLPRARGAAVFGGVGMAEAVAQSRQDSSRGKHFLALAGDEDPLSPHSKEFCNLLCRFAGQAEARTVRAGHSFHQYAACGAVRECVAFVLGLLLE